MGSRVRIAAAGFLVASGLLVGGANSISAHASPAPRSVGAGDGNDAKSESGQKDGTASSPRPGRHDDGSPASSQRPGGRDDGSPRTGSRDDKPDGRKPRDRQPGAGLPHRNPRTPHDEKPTDGESGDGKEGEDGPGGETPPKTPHWPPKEEPPGEEDPDDCWPWPPGPDPDPSPPGSGGGAGPPHRPQVVRPDPPRMQLPQHLLPEHTPSQPGVIDAEPGIGITSPAVPVAPIDLPVIVAPPVALPGGAVPRGLPAEPVPASPRGTAAEPPVGRQAPPAETASNVDSPPASYRAGYPEYLRNAGISQVFAVAAPGLVGMVILTGLGGLVGYRQAKAGRAVRTGGAARFVN
ncbi:hypothetical protein ACIA48_00745 [Mycobacterium sp. NPDC051804]|uniref:hypothetical protein n=1 Tax=Mycobacterium sp. NPDC051804 TaxID=3364295 RepID=UPI003788BC42